MYDGMARQSRYDAARETMARYRWTEREDHCHQIEVATAIAAPTDTVFAVMTISRAAEIIQGVEKAELSTKVDACRHPVSARPRTMFGRSATD